MRLLAGFLALLLGLQIATAQARVAITRGTPPPGTPSSDDSCSARGEIVGYVKKGETTVTMACTSDGASCICHEPASDGKCRVYACDAKGEEIGAQPPPVPAPSPATADTSCSAGGGKVGVVRKGDVSIVLSCPESTGTDSFGCTCHEPTAATDKCRVYACNAKGEEIAKGAETPPAPVTPQAAPQIRVHNDPLPERLRTSGDSSLGSGARISFMKLRAKAGDPKGEFDLGMELARGASMPQNYPEALRLWSDAADKGYPPAQMMMGYQCIWGNVCRDAHMTENEVMMKAFHWFAQGAAEGDANAAAWMGRMYAGGKANQRPLKNQPEAYFWFSLAAKLSEGMPPPEDKEGLGNPFMSHDTMARMAKDLEKKLTPGEIAAAKERLDGWRSGRRAEETREAMRRSDYPPAAAPPPMPAVPPSPSPEEEKAIAAAAKKQFEADQAQLKDIQDKAEKGDAQAEFDLGYLYIRGNGVREMLPPDISEEERNAGARRMSPPMPPGVTLGQDFAKARDWYQKAADKGNVEAQYDLGEMYLYGRGIPKNKEKAFLWLSIAARSGLQILTNQAFLDNSGLPPEKIEALKKQAVDWRPWPYMPEENGKTDDKTP